MYNSVQFIVSLGCWFGDPFNEDMRVWIPGVSKAKLEAVDSQSDANSLAGALLYLLFTRNEIEKGNATPPKTTGIMVLDDNRLHAIGCKYHDLP